jgi:hypothetical protein
MAARKKKAQLPILIPALSFRLIEELMYGIDVRLREKIVTNDA